MKILKLIPQIMVVMGMLSAADAFAGVLHPCTGDQLETVELGSLRLLSRDGQLEARLDTSKVLDKDCINVIHDYFNVRSDIVRVSDGSTIYPAAVLLVLQTLNEQGEVMDSRESQAPLSSGIRLLDGAKAVKILIDGFEPVIIEL